MHEGTSSAISVAFSAMSKKRERGEKQECPVCYEAITRRTEARPFSCDHLMCQTCDRRMRQSDDNRCPTCRAPRMGMTREQAEPPADRNHDPPELEMPLIGFEHYAVPMPGLTMATGSYGGRRFARPNTGHIMHFPIETPQEILDFGRSMGLTEEDIRGPRGLQLPPAVMPTRMPHDILGTGLAQLQGAAGHTLTAMQSTLPADMINALLNLPDVPSLQEWHERAYGFEPPVLIVDEREEEESQTASRSSRRRQQRAASRTRRSSRAAGVVAR